MRQGFTLWGKQSAQPLHWPDDEAVQTLSEVHYSVLLHVLKSFCMNWLLGTTDFAVYMNGLLQLKWSKIMNFLWLAWIIWAIWLVFLCVDFWYRICVKGIVMISNFLYSTLYRKVNWILMILFMKKILRNWLEIWRIFRSVPICYCPNISLSDFSVLNKILIINHWFNDSKSNITDFQSSYQGLVQRTLVVTVTFELPEVIGIRLAHSDVIPVPYCC